MSFEYKTIISTMIAFNNLMSFNIGSYLYLFLRSFQVKVSFYILYVLIYPKNSYEIHSWKKIFCKKFF